MANKTKILNVVVEKATWQSLKEAAKAADCSVASIVRGLVKQYLERRDAM